MELSALRILGLVAGVGVVAYTIWRRRELRNADVLILLATALALVVVSSTGVLNAVLDFLAFKEGGGQRILGMAVLAIIVLLALVLRALTAIGRMQRGLGAVVEGLAWEDFRLDGHPDRFRGKVAMVIPAYNEGESIGDVLGRLPEQVCGVPTAALVVDDGSRDSTSEVARRHGATVARHVVNRGQGASLRAGYRLASESGAEVVVTLDADGQHLPEEMSRLVQPVLDGEVDVAHGSRVLGSSFKNELVRELGSVVFNRLVSTLSGVKMTDCSNGYRAVRAEILPELVFRQEQYHTAEFLLEAIKRGYSFKEVPITVVGRLHGTSRKPANLRYGFGFGFAIVRTWLRAGASVERPAIPAGPTAQ